MSSDTELNWMTSPQYLRGIKTGLTCLNGTGTCFTAVVVAYCGCIMWEYNIKNGSNGMEWSARAWTGWVPLAVRRGYGLK